MAGNKKKMISGKLDWRDVNVGDSSYQVTVDDHCLMVRVKGSSNRVWISEAMAEWLGTVGLSQLRLHNMTDEEKMELAKSMKSPIRCGGKDYPDQHGKDRGGARTVEVCRAGTWHGTEMQKLQVGDRFRLFEASGESVKGRYGEVEFIVKSAPCLTENVWGVETEDISALDRKSYGAGGDCTGCDLDPSVCKGCDREEILDKGVSLDPKTIVEKSVHSLPGGSLLDANTSHIDQSIKEHVDNGWKCVAGTINEAPIREIVFWWRR